jgi:hypothetical protein
MLSAIITFYACPEPALHAMSTSSLLSPPIPHALFDPALHLSQPHSIRLQCCCISHPPRPPPPPPPRGMEGAGQAGGLLHHSFVL